MLCCGKAVKRKVVEESLYLHRKFASAHTLLLVCQSPYTFHGSLLINITKAWLGYLVLHASLHAQKLPHNLLPHKSLTDFLEYLLLALNEWLGHFIQFMVLC